MHRRRKKSSVSIEPLEQRVLLSAAPVRVGTTAFFADKTQPEIHRYDLQNESWLPSVTLVGASAPADFLEVVADGIFVGSGHEVYRYGLDGLDRTLMLTTTDAIDGLHVDTNILFVIQDNQSDTTFFSINRTTGNLIESYRRFGGIKDSEISVQRNRIVGGSGSSPSWNSFVSYTDDGHFTAFGIVSPGADASARTKTWVSPDGASTIIDNGSVYAVDSLQYRLSIGMTISDLDFYGSDVLIAASGQSLLAFDQAYRETGRVTLGFTPDEIFVGNTNVVTFTADMAQSRGYLVGKVALTELNPTVPGSPVDPAGLSFSPDRVFQSADGNVLLYSWKYQSVFRWNPATAAWGATIPLAGFPTAVDYAASNRLYLAYPNGEIRTINLNAASPVEVHFADMRGVTFDLIVADSYVVGVSSDRTSGGVYHTTFRPNGISVSSLPSFYTGKSRVWSHANQKLTALLENSNQIGEEEIDASGSAYPQLVPGQIGQTFYYTTFQSSEAVPPIRIAPDGGVVLLGSGLIADGRSYTRRPETIQPFIDAVWFDRQLFTLHANSQGTLIRAWDQTTFAPRREWEFSGTPEAILPLASEQLFVVTKDGTGVPQFHLLEAELTNSDPRIGFTLNKPEIRVSEDGLTEMFSVVLNSSPAGNVVVELKPASAEISIAATRLTFTPQNWNVAQQVSVSGIDDAEFEADRTSYVTASINPSLSDAGYASAQPQTIVVRNLDNDVLFSGVLPSIRIGDVTWFVRKSTSRIDRFDSATGTWLAPIDLDGEIDHPTAAAVDSDGICIAFGKNVYRYDLVGGSRTLLLTSLGVVNALHTDGDLLLVKAQGSFDASLSSFNKSSGALIDQRSIERDSLEGTSISRQSHRIYGWASRYSTAAVASIGYSAAGILDRTVLRVEREQSALSYETWLFPDETKVLYSGGAIFTTETLTPVGNVTPDISDADFVGTDVAIVVSGRTLSAYAAGLQLLGTLELSGDASELVTSESHVYAMIPDLTTPEGLRVEAFPLSELNVADPGSPVDPTGLAFTPDQVQMANDGTVLLLKKTLNSIFRWNSATQSYDTTIPLSNEPVSMAYSTAHNTVYVSYFDGRIRQIDLSAAIPVERPFAVLTNTVQLAVADDFVVANSYFSHTTLGLDGGIIDSVDSRYGALDAQWSSVNQKLYYVEQQFSVFHLRYIQINANGTAYPAERQGGIGVEIQTYDADSYFIAQPVRVSPDGRMAVLGSGAVFGANSLRKLPHSLANSFLDAVWIDNRLITIREVAGGTEVQEWSSTTFELLNSRFLSGKPSQLRALNDGRMVCIALNSAGIPQFHILDSQLNVVRQAPSILISQSDAGTVVSEDGAADSVQIALSVRPVTNVTVRITGSRPGEVTTAVSFLTFTPDNWNVPQIVEVRGVNDPVIDGDTDSVLTFRVDSLASDPAFSAVSESVNVLKLDDESGVSGFLPAIRFNDVAWFVSRSSGRIERFDFNANAWLEPLRLPGNAGHATAAAIDADGVYVAFGGTVYRYRLDGQQRTHLINAPYGSAGSIFSDGDLLIMGAPQFISLRKTDNQVIEINNEFRGIPSAQSLSRNLLVSVDADTSTFSWSSYTDAGQFAGLQSFSYPRIRLPSDRLWVSPAGLQLFDSLGRVHSTTSRQQTGFIGTTITDMDFLNNGAPVVLSGDLLTLYSEALLPVGSFLLTRSPQEIFAYSPSNSIFTFLVSPSSAHGLSVLRVGFSALKPEVPSIPPSPVGLAFTPDSVALTNDSRLLLFSKVHRCIFQWNLVTQRYAATIALTGSPVSVAYSAHSDTIFVADASGLIRKVDLSAATPTLATVRFLYSRTASLVAVGKYLFAVELLGNEIHFRTYREDVLPVDTTLQGVISAEYAWNASNQKLYSLASNGSTTTVFSTEIEARGDVYPLVGPGGFGRLILGSVNTASGSDKFHVSPIGDVVVLGSGQILDAKTLQLIGFIPGPFADIGWLPDGLLTMQSSGQQTLIRRWLKTGPGHYAAKASTTVSGSPVAMLTGEDRVVVITRDSQSRLMITLLDESLYLVPDAPAIIPPKSRIFQMSAPTFEWTAFPEAVEYNLFLFDATGKKVSELRTTQQHAAFSGLLPNGVYHLQVRARLANGTNSPWSGPLRFQIDTLQLLAPVPVSTRQKPFVSWQGHSDAASYEVWVNNLDTKTVAFRKSGITSRFFTINESLLVGQYAVWVRSVDASGDVSPWSDRRVFEIIHPPVTITSGVGGTNDSTPLISWQTLPSVDSYELIVKRNSDRKNVYRAANVKAGFLEIPQALAGDEYTVWVRGWMNGRAVSAWGPGTQLTVQAPPRVSHRISGLSWNAIPAAVSYDIRLVRIRTGEVVVSQSHFFRTDLAINPPLTPARYRVEARSNYVGGEHSEWSVSEFEVFHPPVVLRALPAATMDQTLVVQWVQVAGATSYEILVQSAIGKSQIYRQSGITGTQHRIVTPLPNGQVTIWVRASFAEGSPSAWGAGDDVTIGPAPLLRRTGSRLAWTLIDAATHYEIWVNVQEVGKKYPSPFVRADLVVGAEFELPSLVNGSYRAWIRAVRAESGTAYLGQWSLPLDFTI